MKQLILLLKTKFIIVFGNLRAILLIVSALIILTSVYGVLLQESNLQIRVLLVAEEQNSIVQALREVQSDVIKIDMVTKDKALEEIRQYKAELAVEISSDILTKIKSGQRKNLLDVYYLKGNLLAPFLMDRLIGSLMPEVYSDIAENNIHEIYRKFEIDSPPRNTNRQEKMDALRKEWQDGKYFRVTTDSKYGASQQSDTGSFLRIYALSVILMAINFIFLTYFSLKLLSIRSKNDRMKLANLKEWQQLISDMLLLALPQTSILAALMSINPAFVGVVAILLMINIVIQSIMIRIIKDKRLYFSSGLVLFFILLFFGLLSFR